MKIYKTDAIVLRAKLRANPDVLYLFGDNLIRRGLGGQAKQSRGEPNAVGIVTKRLPSRDSSAYIHDTDTDIDHIKRIIDKDFIRINSLISTNNYRAIVIPPIGTGLADLHINAPKLLEYINKQLDKLGQ